MAVVLSSFDLTEQAAGCVEWNCAQTS